MKGSTEIKVQGRVGMEWSECFDGLQISHEQNISVIKVSIKDESHLHGILDWIRDLNLSIISINREGD